MFKKAKLRLFRTLASLGLFSAEIIIITLVFFSALFLFSYLVREVFVLQNAQIDKTIFAYVGSRVSPRNTEWMEAITFLGTHYFLIPANIILAAYFFFISRHKWYSIKIISIALSSTLLMFILKFIFSRQRPLLPLVKPALGYSFPSGHSLIGFAFYGLLIHITYHYIKNGYIKWLLIVLFAFLILLIGISRIYLRVHYPTDVLAGFSVGVIWLMASLWLLRRMERYSKKTIEPAIEHTVHTKKPTGN